MRDYCQHGEPMDEHCPQCNTKAAANDSATAPVPAGGTPEGLAREKVEMTDLEVKPSSPTTEAGRDLLSALTANQEAVAFLSRQVRDLLGTGEAATPIDFRDTILAIEQQARDEGDTEGYIRGVGNGVRQGRQEAVREAKERLAGFYHRSDSSPDNHPGVFAILDRVTGLDGEGRSPTGSNASESPPTDEHIVVADTLEAAEVAIFGPEEAARRRAASESPPMDPAFAHDAGPNAYPDDFPGDASESPPTHSCRQGIEPCAACEAADAVGDASESPPPSARDPIHAWHEDNDERPDASESGQPPLCKWIDHLWNEKGRCAKCGVLR